MDWKYSIFFLLLQTIRSVQTSLLRSKLRDYHWRGILSFLNSPNDLYNSNICPMTRTISQFRILSQLVLSTMAAASAPAAFGASQDARSHTAPKPNVLLIYADDLGFGDLGCYGAIGVETPNIDRLATQGTRFTNAHAAASTSTPSRYGMLTGEYAWRKSGTDVAAGNAAMIISPHQLTMADIFKSAGYATAAFGKWHLGLGEKSGQQDWNAPIPSTPGDLGFDHSYIMAATADRVPCVFIRNGMVADYDPEAPIEVSYTHNFEGEPTGRDNPDMLYNMKSSHGHDQSIVNGIGRIGYMRGGGKALWRDENIADSITANTINYITQQVSEGKPFFVYMATNDVHVPRFPHPRFRGTSPMGLRGEAIAQFDWTVGRVLDTLDSLGITDNTLVILSSDNGPVLDDGYEDMAEELVGEHSPTGGLRGGKYSCFEGGTRIPLIVRWPEGGVEAGAVSGSLLSQIDWLATMAQLTSIPIPSGAARDSRPMLDALLGCGEGRPYVIEQASNHALSVRTPQWKYIEPSMGTPMVSWGPKIETGYLNSPQLFDMTDSSEHTECASSHPEIVKEMNDILVRVREGDDR